MDEMGRFSEIIKIIPTDCFSSFYPLQKNPHFPSNLCSSLRKHTMNLSFDNSSEFLPVCRVL